MKFGKTNLETSESWTEMKEIWKNSLLIKNYLLMFISTWQEILSSSFPHKVLFGNKFASKPITCSYIIIVSQKCCVHIINNNYEDVSIVLCVRNGQASLFKILNDFKSSKQLINDIIGWDIKNWGKSISFFENNFL